MARAFCSTCNTYPIELLSWPIIGDNDGEAVKSEEAVILNNDGTPTNRWADGTAGVPEDVQQMAGEDEEPVCAECNNYIVWKHAGFLKQFDQEHEEPSEAFGAAVDELWKVSFKQLAYLATHVMTDDEKYQLGRQFMGLAANAARIGTYLDMRGGNGNGDQGHEKAVKEQNQVGRKVRHVLGYQNTPDINF
jgi:hypothetical protein